MTLLAVWYIKSSKKIGGFSESEAVQRAYEKKLDEKHALVLRLQREASKTEKDLQNLRNEVLKALSGKAPLIPTLNSLIKDLEMKCREQQAALAAAQQDEDENISLMRQMRQDYSRFVQWADVYDAANMETKKMIVSQLLRGLRSIVAIS